MSKTIRLLKQILNTFPMDEFITEARKRIENTYGADFTAKLSDQLCLLLGKSTLRTAGFREGGRPDKPLYNQLIVECTAPQPPVREAVPPAVVQRIAEAVNNWGPLVEQVAPQVAQLFQRQELQTARDVVLNAVQSLNAFLSRVAQPPEGPAPLPPTERSPVCWLNQTMRTSAHPRHLAEMAADPAVQRFDLPRKIRRDIAVTGPAIGAPQFRQTQSCNGAKINVAVIDSEIFLGHPSLQNRVIHMENYTKEPWGNPDPHGTAVAGIIASADPQYTGVAPGVMLYNYKVMATDPELDSDDFEGTLALQKALEDGMHLANCSWGTGLIENSTSREARAFDAAWRLGLTIVKSAGNEGSSGLTIPAEAEGVIVVGATNKQGSAIETYSGRGPLWLGQQRPHLVAPGGFTDDELLSANTGGQFAAVGYGTSYAAPHVTGALALVLEKNPGFSPDELRNYILQQCKQMAGYSANEQGMGLLSL